ncbi:zinc ribbon domain-containing protein [Micromonospora haikouensis]|uniref:zinc-ribbon domain-containing protein n=1 Tax=Micromonospora haikouensis TaxID=686309 RepID=UPI0033EAB198
MRTCDNCGAEVSPGDGFCGNCGAFLAWNDPTPPPACRCACRPPSRPRRTPPRRCAPPAHPRR